MFWVGFSTRKSSSTDWTFNCSRTTSSELVYDTSTDWTHNCFRTTSSELVSPTSLRIFTARNGHRWRDQKETFTMPNEAKIGFIEWMKISHWIGHRVVNISKEITIPSLTDSQGTLYWNFVRFFYKNAFERNSSTPINNGYTAFTHNCDMCRGQCDHICIRSNNLHS